MNNEPRRAGCLDANMLAEYIDGGLDPRQRADVEAHLADCGECYETFAETVRITAEGPAIATGAPSPSNASTMSRWYVWAAAACLVIASGAGIYWWTRPDHAAQRSLSQLARVDGPERPALGRLSGPFAWKPEPAAMRGGDAAANPPVALRSAALTLEALATDHPSAATLHAHGLALIAMGQAVDAIDVLTRAVALAAKTPQEADIRSDLGVAWLEKWRRTNEPQDAARGLSETEVALATGARSPAGLFNRALAITALGLEASARSAWRDYLAVESSGPWADEARRRLSQLEGKTVPVPTPKDLAAMSLKDLRQVAQSHADLLYAYFDETIAPTWARAVLARTTPPDLRASLLADALEQEGREPATIAQLRALATSGRWTAQRRDCLASAIDKLATARRRWDAADRAGALDAAQSAAAQFTCARVSPLPADALWAWDAFVMGRRSDALGKFPALINAAEQQGHWRVAADLLRLRGVGQLGAGRPSDAIADYNLGIGYADRSGDRVRSALIGTNLAEASAMLGDYRASWQYLRPGFAVMGTTDMTPSSRYSIVSSGVATASREGLAGTVLALARAAEETTADWSRPDGRIYCALQRARAYVMLDRRAEADAQIARADTLIGQQSEATIRTAWQTELDVTRGFALVSNHPGSAAGSFEDAVRSLSSQNRPFRVAELLLHKGRALAGQGRMGDARIAWEHGLAILEDQRADIRDEQLKILRTASLWDLYGELIDATLPNPSESLSYAERSRARQLLDRMTAGASPPQVTPASLQSALRPREIALIYAVESRRLVLWTVTRASVTVTTRVVTAGDLATLVGQSRAGLMSDTTSPALRSLAEIVLPASLDLSVCERLIVIPDGVLQSLPFAALTLADGRYLIEHVPVVLAPSLTTFAVASSRASAAPITSAALIGYAGPVVKAGLAALPGVAEEIARVAAAYPMHHVLTGRDATLRALTEVAARVDVIHIAGHAQVDRAAPAQSRLWLAADREDVGGVSAAQLASLRVRTGATVVLGACDTAIGADVKGEGASSFVPPFLAAGAGLVVGTLWPISDRASIAAFETLHAQLRRGGVAADAVSIVQRQLLATHTPRSVWASLAAYGGRIRGEG